MAKPFCPHCDVMLTRKALAEGRCDRCGKKLPHCPQCDATLTQKDLDERRCDACGKKVIFCPFCDVLLTKKDLADGWCDACGKKLPLAIMSPAQPRQRASLPAEYYVPARKPPPNSKLYRFASRMERICLGLLLFVFASCVGVPAAVLLFSKLEWPWPFETEWTVQRTITVAQFALIIALVAGMLVAKGLKVLCGTDGS